jgi:hypothetical protein
MQHVWLETVSDVVLRCFRFIALVREITRVEEILLRQHSSGMSQWGSYARYRERYVVSISALTAGSLAFVGTLWIRNLVQCPLMYGSIGWRDLISVVSICR